jgi:hypothetical protein
VSPTSRIRSPWPGSSPIWHLDGQTICAALLHDVIEDTPTVKDEIVARFGREVGELVDGVSKLDKVQFKSRKEAQAESFPKDDFGHDTGHPRDHGQARGSHS